MIANEMPAVLLQLIIFEAGTRHPCSRAGALALFERLFSLSLFPLMTRFTCCHFRHLLRRRKGNGKNRRLSRFTQPGRLPPSSDIRALHPLLLSKDSLLAQA